MRYLIISGIVVFILGGFGQTLVECPQCFDTWDTAWPMMLYSGLLWMFLWKGSEILVLLLNQWKTWIEAPVRRFIAALVLTVTYTIIVYFGLLLLTKSTMSGQDYLEMVGYEETSMDLVSVLIITLGINTFMHGRAFLYSWREEAIRIQKMKTDQVSSQYRNLKSQVNPHFLFNSLNALSSLVYDDQDKAVEFIRKLSEVYRYVLDQSENEVVALEEELMFVRSYIFLQQIRFGQNLIYEENIPEVLDKYVLPVSVQMLIENAIKHNIVDHEHQLYIKLDIDNDYLTISNNLHPKKVASTGIGLDNLKTRYAHLIDRDMRVIQSDNKFIVEMPLLELQ